MPFELLDFMLAGIMLVSGLLALMRGFTREVLSLVAWGLAAVAGLYAALHPDLTAFVGQYVQSDVIAKIAVGGAAFLIVLIILSTIGVRLADWVLDSAAGPFDRTLGLVYGLARGLLLVVIAYLFYVWLVPPEKREEWVRNARALPMIEAAGGFVTDFLPADIRDTLQNRIAAGARQPGVQTGSDREEQEGYRSGDTTVLDQLIESTRSGRQDQAPEQQQQQQEPQQQEDLPSFGSQSGQN